MMWQWITIKKQGFETFLQNLNIQMLRLTQVINNLSPSRNISRAVRPDGYIDASSRNTLYVLEPGDTVLGVNNAVIGQALYIRGNTGATLTDSPRLTVGTPSLAVDENTVICLICVGSGGNGESVMMRL